MQYPRIPPITPRPIRLPIIPSQIYLLVIEYEDSVSVPDKSQLNGKIYGAYYSYASAFSAKKENMKIIGPIDIMDNYNKINHPNIYDEDDNDNDISLTRPKNPVPNDTLYDTSFNYII